MKPWWEGTLLHFLFHIVIFLFKCVLLFANFLLLLLGLHPGVRLLIDLGYLSLVLPIKLVLNLVYTIVVGCCNVALVNSKSMRLASRFFGGHHFVKQISIHFLFVAFTHLTIWIHCIHLAATLRVGLLHLCRVGVRRMLLVIWHVLGVPVLQRSYSLLAILVCFGHLEVFILWSITKLIRLVVNLVSNTFVVVDHILFFRFRTLLDWICILRKIVMFAVLAFNWTNPLMGVRLLLLDVVLVVAFVQIKVIFTIRRF